MNPPPFNQLSLTCLLLLISSTLLIACGNKEPARPSLAIEQAAQPSIYTRLIKEHSSTISTPRLKGIINSHNLIQARQHTMNYIARNTPQGRAITNKKGTYPKDDHLWVYKPDFAQRFGMPPEWIDKHLSGAEAIAYRMDWDIYGNYCTDPPHCRPLPACVMDLYIRADTPLPWLSTRTHNSRYGRKSDRWLRHINDQPQELNAMGPIELSVSDNKQAPLTVALLAYDKEIYKNIVYLSVAVACQPLTQTTKGESYTLRFYRTDAPEPMHSLTIPSVLRNEIHAHQQQIARYQQLIHLPTPAHKETNTATRDKTTASRYQDQHIWGYTAEFAERFNLPEQWIDQALNGAEAVAYRVDWDNYGTKCGYFRGLEHCRPAPACVIDIYLKDSVKLPWNSSVQYNQIYGYKSKIFLSSQRDNDKPAYLYRKVLRRGSYYMGLDGAGVRHDPNKTSGLGNYSIMEYDRDIYPGLDYLSGTTSCSFAKSRDVAIQIYQKINGKLNSTGAHIAHRVQPGNSFMQRADQYHTQVYAPNSLFKSLQQQLQTQQQTTSTSSISTT